MTKMYKTTSKREEGSRLAYNTTKDAAMSCTMHTQRSHGEKITYFFDFLLLRSLWVRLPSNIQQA